MSNSQKIYFFSQKPIRLANKGKIKRIISILFLKEKKELVALNCIFCSDTFLLKINQQFLNHNFFTDVITFNLSPNELKIEGEIYISIDRVKQNSIKLGVDRSEELLRVILHGALHLCGYNDKNLSQIIKMRKRENELLRLYNRFP